MAPDGSYLIFASNRPATDGGAPLDGNYGGAVRPGRGGNLWRVDRRGGGWSKPVRLPEAVNANTSVFSPSVVADGSLYFMKPSPETDDSRSIGRSGRTVSTIRPNACRSATSSGATSIPP